MPPGGPGGSAAARSGLPLAMAAAAALSPRPAAPGARPAPLAARWVCLLSAQLQPNGVRAGTSQEIPILPPTHTSAARGWGWGMGPIGAGGGATGPALGSPLTPRRGLPGCRRSPRTGPSRLRDGGRPTSVGAIGSPPGGSRGSRGWGVCTAPVSPGARAWCRTHAMARVTCGKRPPPRHVSLGLAIPI